VEAVLASCGRYEPAIKDIARSLFSPGGSEILSFPSISLSLHASSQLGNSGMRAIDKSGVGRTGASFSRVDEPMLESLGAGLVLYFRYS
jgi:hypothetical protein